MPKRTTPFNIRLSPDDLNRFDTQCHKEGKNRTELARDLIREGLANRESEDMQEIDSEYAQEVRKQTDRLAGILRKNNIEFTDRVAGLLVKMALDNATVMNIFYHRTREDMRDEVFSIARRQAIETVTQELKGPLTIELLESLKHALSGEA